MRGHRDLMLVAAAAAVCAAGCLIAPLGAVRVIFAVPLALILPGYAVAAAATGRRRLSGPLLLPFGVGLSLATLALGSILLNYTPGGIRLLPWVLLLVGVVLGCCRVAALRRPAAADARLPSLPRLSPLGIFLTAGAVAMTIAALVLAQATLEANRAFGYTELWIVPPEQTGSVLHVGVESEQQDDVAYILEVRIGRGSKTAASAFSLSPGEARTFTFPVPPAATATPVWARLYRRGPPNRVYRRVGAWFPATARKAS